MHKRLFHSILWLSAISLVMCLNQDPTVQAAGAQHVHSDTQSLNKEALCKIYTQAIADYVAEVHQKDNIYFDTLFVGNTGGFPDITLPNRISHTEVRVLTQQEVDQKKSVYSVKSPYINLIGFVEPDQAKFIFVAFYPGFSHQFDVYLHYKMDAGKMEYLLNDARIEVLLLNKEGKADHYAVYKAGKYIGDKPIDK